MTESTATATVSDLTVIFESAVNGDLAPFATADGPTKRAVKINVEKSIKDALRAKEYEVAGDLQDVLDAMIDFKITKASTEVDVTALLADKINSFQVATLMLATFGAPDGSEVDMERLLVLIDEEPASESAVLAGIALAESVKITRTARSESRVDLAAHVAEVISAHESGTFLKISEVAKVSTEAAPNGLPSQGALAARLFPTSGDCTLAGVEPVAATSTSPKGLRVL